MSDELFTTEPTAPTPLMQARARLEKAGAEVERLEQCYDEQVAAIGLPLLAAIRELKSAENSAKVEEIRELERLKQKTK